MTNTPSPFSLIRKDWDSEFFGREIRSLELGEAFDPDLLEVELSRIDALGVWGVEAVVDASHFVDAPALEDLGFRLVDSKAVFVTEMTADQIEPVRLPEGVVRRVGEADLERVHLLTVGGLVDNAEFRSRFKDPRLFRRSESIAYYDAWNQRAFNEAPELFHVWDVGGDVVAFFNFVRSGTADGLPLFKGVLTAVDPDYRGHAAQNHLQQSIFPEFACGAWVLESVTQITNTRVIKNHIRAGKAFRGASLVFYRLRGGGIDRDRRQGFQ